MVCDRGIVAATTEYGGTLIAAIKSDNIFATQFHPEKSDVSGLKLFRRYFNEIGAKPWSKNA
jgi:glutamine amidotransferase